jgi:amino acid adenylation domain-containing protein
MSVNPQDSGLTQLTETTEGVAAPSTTQDSSQSSDEVYLFPLSFGQERLWFLDQFMPGTPLFNLNQAHRISIPLVPSFLQHSLSEMVRRHEILRTTFQVVDGEPMQVVAKQQRAQLPIIDLSGRPLQVREEEAIRIATEEARLPFDLQHGPLLRTKLLRLTPDDWIFLVTMHHIVSDGWSMVVFWRELRAIWSEFAKHNKSPLPDLSIQYGDFAAWQRSTMAGATLQRQIQYWRKQLEGVHALELPADRKRPETPTNAGLMYHFSLPNSLVIGLQDVARKPGATLFMTLLAAFQVLLHRYTGETDITVGTYIAGRNRSELEPLIGFFLNSLAMRIDVSGDPTFLEVLARAKDMTLDAYAHQELPFAKLVQELRPERNLTRNPFFQIVFQMLNLPPVSKDFRHADTPQLAVQRGTAIFDLTFTFWESGDLLKGHIEYNTDLFQTNTIQRFVSHYMRLLAGVVADPSKHISELPLLTVEEREKALHSWNNTDCEVSQDSMARLLEQQAQDAPHAVAVIDGERRLTFSELNCAANQLAYRLMSLGVGSEVLAAILLERSAQAVIALMAVMKTGGAFLLLDPSYPADQLANMLADAAPRVVITESQWSSQVTRFNGPVVWLDREADDILGEKNTNPDVAYVPQSLAYVIYTSGSTGNPKGVAAEYQQVINRLAWMWRTQPFQKGEVGCQKTALHFVDFIWEILGPLLRGIPIVIVSSAKMRDINALVLELALHGVTRIWLVPSLLRALLDDVPDLREKLPSLRFWVTTGEALSVDLLRLFHKKLPDSTLYNLYGTSEIWDATWYVTDCDDELAMHQSIGYPIDNTRCYVLDSHLRVVPAGVIGELYVGGVGVARGYLNQPVLTATKFVPDPFSSSPGARLYRTGDLARWRDDGAIEYVGRIDHQVKIRGYRLEPAEVGALLERHPDIAKAVVIPAQHAGETRLHAFYVLRGQRCPTAAELRSFIRKLGHEHLVPHQFCALASLPLLPNGKLDRQTLAHLAPLNGHMTANPVTAPQTSVEQRIAAMWRDVLGVKDIGVDENFFDLGGHSLSLVKVHLRLMNELKANLSIIDLFSHPTIQSIASMLEQRTSESLKAG